MFLFPFFILEVVSGNMCVSASAFLFFLGKLGYCHLLFPFQLFDTAKTFLVDICRLESTKECSALYRGSNG